MDLVIYKRKTNLSTVKLLRVYQKVGPEQSVVTKANRVRWDVAKQRKTKIHKSAARIQIRHPLALLRRYVNFVQRHYPYKDPV